MEAESQAGPGERGKKKVKKGCRLILASEVAGRMLEKGHQGNLCCSCPSLLTPLLCPSDLSASGLTLTRQDVIYSGMSVCTHGLFLVHA